MIGVTPCTVVLKVGCIVDERRGGKTSNLIGDVNVINVDGI